MLTVALMGAHCTSQLLRAAETAAVSCEATGSELRQDQQTSLKGDRGFMPISAACIREDVHVS